MALNIKNDRVHMLAREAAQLAGTSQASAIEQALEQYLRSHGRDPAAADRQRRLARMREIGERYRREEAVPTRGIVRVEDLYDETTGLPR
ncbi:type II toxin-antitoxin system VapB family antitoxin [Microbacterium sp.]|uniref:type II toxin-antitoxin system VapB family antitoxin n=1 Tax=Microbacterium sp. TaxID=51671 RepID=UPI0039E4742F